MKRECRPGVIYRFHFFIVMNYSDKSDWKQKRLEWYRYITISPFSAYTKDRIKRYGDGLYESPKFYDDEGFAYNDGSWLKFKVCYMKNGKFRGRTVCKNRKDVISCLYGYISFLRRIGVSTVKEFEYFSAVYIVDKLEFGDKVFTVKKNLKKLDDMIKEIMSKDISELKCGVEDSRKYCMDDKLKKDKTSGEKIGIQRKKDKELDWKKIEELYDSSKTNIQNLMEFRKNGLIISERTLQNWKKSRK